MTSCSNKEQINRSYHAQESVSSSDTQSDNAKKAQVIPKDSRETIVASSESDTGFGIYLEENGKLLISDKHIKAYYKDTHEIELNEKGIERIKSEKELNMKGFVVKVNDKEIYKGKLWSGLNSAIYPGVIISDVLAVPFSNNGKLKIDFGCPSPQYAKGKDPRNKPEIIDCFKEKGILN